MLGFFILFVLQYHIVSQCDTFMDVTKYQYHVTLVIKCVKGGHLVTDLNKVLGAPTNYCRCLTEF
jgi:hypothetical protein